MALSPLLLLGGAAAAALLLMKKDSLTEVVGPSNTHWLTKSRSQDGVTYTQVFAKSGQFGPHQDTLVLTYASPTGATEPRNLVSLSQGLPQQMVNLAVKDFKVTAPKKS